MAFNIVLQSTTSEKNRMDKTINDIATYSGTLRADTSIVDPVFLVECDLANVVNANYLTVQAFGRSYFINNIRSMRAGLVEFTCHCDVLSSFKTQIRQNHAIMHRSERNWNLYLNDGSLKMTQRPEKIVTEHFSNELAFVNHFSYVLVLAG